MSINVDAVSVSTAPSTRNPATATTVQRRWAAGATFGARLRLTMPPMESAVAANTSTPDSAAPAATSPSIHSGSRPFAVTMNTVLGSSRSG